MARTPNYDLSKQPQWVQERIYALQEQVTDLEDEVRSLNGIVATLEGLFERASIVEIDGIPVDSTVEVVQGGQHEETTPAPCPTPYCKCTSSWM